MAVYRYEKYVGYNKKELKYKKQTVVDEVSGKETVKLVERTPAEVEEYKAQKELEFDAMEANWQRLKIRNLVTSKGFDQEKFNKMYLKLIDNRLSEIVQENNSEDLETRMVNSIQDVDDKYNLRVAFEFYGIKEDGQFDTSKIFKGLKRANIENMFYRKISVEKAEEMARNRMSSANTLSEGVSAIQELLRTHNSRSIFFKIFHPFKNAQENRLIRELKDTAIQKFNISHNKLENRLNKRIDKTGIKGANPYKLDDFVSKYCLEEAGKLYSQKIIDEDRQDVAERAEDDFIDAQMSLERMTINEEPQEKRDPIVVEDAKSQDEIKQNFEPVVNDSIVIKVPKK